MVTRYRLSMDGTQLDECLRPYESYKKYWDKIVILDISYARPEFNKAIETAGDNDGGVITRSYRQKASVTVTFGLYIYDVVDRFNVCQIIKSHARMCKTVKTNDRVNVALENCVCDQYPEIESARDWTKPLTMTFSSYAFPYWQEDQGDKPYASTRTLAGTGNAVNSMSIYIPGNAPVAKCCVEFTPSTNYKKNISFKTAGITVGINSYKLAISYPFEAHNYCVIDYDDNNNLRARVYDNKTNMKLLGSILEYILPESSDKLIATPGYTNTYMMKASYYTTVTFKVRGTYL